MNKNELSLFCQKYSMNTTYTPNAVLVYTSMNICRHVCIPDSGYTCRVCSYFHQNTKLKKQNAHINTFLFVVYVKLMLIQRSSLDLKPFRPRILCIADSLSAWCSYSLVLVRRLSNNELTKQINFTNRRSMVVSTSSKSSKLRWPVLVLWSRCRYECNFFFNRSKCCIV